MPWSTPTLAEVRGLVRDSIQAKLPGADALVPNSVLRVLSDNQGALCHEVLQYIDWLALQLLPDTAEAEWLDRHADIWLVNSDSTTGRKMATLASGSGTFTGVAGTTVPLGSQLDGSGVSYATTQSIIIGSGPTICTVQALDPGAIGNQDQGTTLSLTSDVPDVDSAFTVIDITGGVDTENDNDLRARILQRIQSPPMGGSESDYVTWALAVPGVTRAWAAPEQGVGTITVRFLMDELRASDDGWPQPSDITAVANYIDSVRPVTVKNCFVVAPIKQIIDITILDLQPDTSETEAAVELSIQNMLHAKAFPGQTIYASWISYAIMSTPTVTSFNLASVSDYVMPAPGYMAVLGTILFETS